MLINAVNVIHQTKFTILNANLDLRFWCPAYNLTFACLRISLAGCGLICIKNDALFYGSRVLCVSKPSELLVMLKLLPRCIAFDTLLYSEVLNEYSCVSFQV